MNLEINFVVINWDGKLLPDLIGEENVDRLPVIATAPGLEQFLEVPKIPSGIEVFQSYLK